MTFKLTVRFAADTDSDALKNLIRSSVRPNSAEILQHSAVMDSLIKNKN